MNQNNAIAVTSAPPAATSSDELKNRPPRPKLPLDQLSPMVRVSAFHRKFASAWKKISIPNVANICAIIEDSSRWRATVR